MTKIKNSYTTIVYKVYLQHKLFSNVDLSLKVYSYIYK